MTNVADFKKLIARIPADRFKNVWFFPLRQDRKNPDVPSGTILKGNLAYRLDVKSCLYRLKQGKNVGIYGLLGGLMFLDLDVSKGEIIASEHFMKQIPSTFMVRTRNGGYQYYYLNQGLYPNQIIKENNIQIGELRTNWYYVVGAGSFVTPDENNNGGDGTYRVIKDIPIAEFSGVGNYIQQGIIKDDLERFSKVTLKQDEVTLEDYNKKLVEKGKTNKRKLDTEQIKNIMWQMENKIPRA